MCVCLCVCIKCSGQRKAVIYLVDSTLPALVSGIIHLILSHVKLKTSWPARDVPSANLCARDGLWIWLCRHRSYNNTYLLLLSLHWSFLTFFPGYSHTPSHVYLLRSVFILSFVFIYKQGNYGGWELNVFDTL